mgnify:CR=1 FL=1
MAKLSTEDIKLRHSITKRFIDLRESTGMSQSEFAKFHELDRQQVNRWESLVDARGVTIYTIQKFCTLLNISLSDFFDDPLFK